MWEMQALTSTPTLSHLDDSQSPTNTNRGLGGGLADMDTSNDDKSDNDTSGMDCLSPDKLDCGQSCSSSGGGGGGGGGDTHPHHQHHQHQHQPAHFHQLLQTHGGASAAAAAAACGEHLTGQANTATAAAREYLQQGKCNYREQKMGMANKIENG